LNRAYLLDTSAIFALTDNEEGADTVEDYLDKAKSAQVSLHYSAMTAMELYYVTLGERGEEAANRLLFLVRALPATELPLDDALILPAAKIKARYKVSVADAWIAAAAQVHNLVLVHKDPEFEALEEGVSLLTLPYKSSRKR
jgi:predicted nucleic acid-binding protein